MGRYHIESEGRVLSGKIICGSLVGYTGDKCYSLDDLVNFVDISNVTKPENLPVIPCILYEGKLVSRSGNQTYVEKVYELNFACSPRIEQPSKESFYRSLIDYAEQIGLNMEQERIYVEFEGKTVVLKNGNK